jgi:hypothetical protein
VSVKSVEITCLYELYDPTAQNGSKTCIVFVGLDSGVDSETFQKVQYALMARPSDGQLYPLYGFDYSCF